MKKIILFLIISIALSSCKTKKQEAPTRQVISSQYESSFSPISDFSNIFNENQKDSLKLKIMDFEQKTTNEITIVTKDSIQGDIGLYATNLANTMGVGKKDKDNGLLILLVKPMRMVRIATGNGTMNILTDPICQNIIDQHMLPEFKKDNYYKGIDNALDEIIKQWTRE